jgi:hypothetical protein
VRYYASRLQQRADRAALLDHQIPSDLFRCEQRSREQPARKEQRHDHYGTSHRPNGEEECEQFYPN